MTFGLLLLAAVCLLFHVFQAIIAAAILAACPRLEKHVEGLSFAILIVLLTFIVFHDIL